MYFRLNPECYYIKGELAGSIYDLIHGDVYALTPEESRMIEACERNLPADPTNQFLCELRQRVVGNFFPKKVFIEKLRIGSPIADYQQGKPPFLARAFIEINNTCGKSCWYCGFRGISRSLGCLGCNIWNETGVPVTTSRWKELIDELFCLRCKSLVVKGGDLSSVWEHTHDILDYAASRFESVLLIGHHEHLTREICDHLGENVHLLLQTENLTIRDPRYSYLFVTEYEKSQELLSDLPENVMLDFVSRTFDPLQLGSILSSGRKIQKTNLVRFTHNNKFHPCLGNSITISWNGEVLPCPMIRHNSLGNIQNRKLWSFLQGTPDSIQEFWKISQGNISRCRECEFRYSCTDCRALEISLTGDLFGKVLCNYDPAKGTWRRAAD